VLLGCSAGAAAAAIVLLGSTQQRAGVLLLSACAGFLLGSISLARVAGTAARAYLPVAGSDVSAFDATVTQDSTLSRKGQTILRARLEDAASARAGITARARGAVLLVLDGDYRFAMGERLRVAGPLQALPPPGAEQFITFVERSSIRSQGWSGAAWRARAAAREWLHHTLSGTGYPVSALMEALLVGSREDVPADLSDDFLRTGSLHILALSGLHVTVLYGVMALFLRFLRGRWLKFLIAAALLVFYQVLAGFMPSLLRATVMILSGGLAFCADRDGEPLNILSLSGVIIIMVDPFQVQTISFQLSYLAMAGIFAIGPLVQGPLEGRIPRILLVPLAMSVGAQAATLPLVASAFGSWYPSGLAAGLLLVPLTTVLLWAGLAWIPLSLIPLPVLHETCVRILAILYAVIQWIAHLFAGVPGVLFGSRELPWVAAALFTALVGLGLLVPRPRRPRQAAA
jgi:ComEC/Rec2-related protein